VPSFHHEGITSIIIRGQKLPRGFALGPPAELPVSPDRYAVANLAFTSLSIEDFLNGNGLPRLQELVQEVPGQQAIVAFRFEQERR